MESLHNHNADPKPFVWTKSAGHNGNGKVDGFDELFGSPTASGFVELGASDST